MKRYRKMGNPRVKRLFELWRRTNKELGWLIRYQQVGEVICWWSIVLPSTKCKLRLLQLKRVYDYLQIETEYVRNKSEAKKSEGGKDVCFWLVLWRIGEWIDDWVYSRISSEHLYGWRDYRWRSRYYQSSRCSSISSWCCLLCGQRSPWTKLFCPCKSNCSPFLPFLISSRFSSLVLCQRIQAVLSMLCVLKRLLKKLTQTSVV